VEDLAAGRIIEKIENWAEMKEALKAQFGHGEPSMDHKKSIVGSQACW
jgi:hypothetical protein